MRDQADKLRLRMQMLANQETMGRSIAVVSGKGGVGKSNFTTNFAINLAKLGKRVVVLDMDIGMGNVNVLIGKNAHYSLKDYLVGDVGISDTLYDGPNDIKYISGGSGMSSVMEWSNEMFNALISGFEELQKRFDFILFDMGAGATSWSLDLITSIDEVIVVTNAEPTSMTDAYSMMKYIYLKDPNKIFYLLCNRAFSKEEGQETLLRLRMTMFKFLNKEVYLLGSLPEDSTVRKAVREQIPFSIAYPNSNVSLALNRIVQKFVSQQIEEATILGKQNSFLSKLKNIFVKGRG